VTQDFSFILDSLKFSNSSVNSFETCSLMFKLSYIDAKEKIENFYSQFGNHVHRTLEMYFDNKLEIFQLANYYAENFGVNITVAPPPFPKDLVSKYFEDGLTFFNDFSWDRDGLEILFREDFINSKIDNIELVVKPDLVVREKETNQVILIDYKTAKIMKGKYIDKKKLEEYKKQMFLYSYIIGKEKGISIDKIKLLFIREKDPLAQIQEVCYTQEDGENTIKEFLETVSKIKAESEWKSKQKIDYFCSEICSVRLSCPLYVSKFGLDISNQFVQE